MENVKNQLTIFLLFLLMVLTVFAGVFSWVLPIDVIFKILLSLVCFALSIFIYIGIRKTNAKLIYVEREVKEDVIRCPKCFNEYDGVECLICGYKRTE